MREQYIDFYDNNKDDIFITAKGVITLKHIGNIQNQVYNYENVCTYEMRCEGYESYQAYIDTITTYFLAYCTISPTMVKYSPSKYYFVCHRIRGGESIYERAIIWHYGDDCQNT